MKAPSTLQIINHKHNTCEQSIKCFALPNDD